MTRTVSTTEAKNSLNALMTWAEEHDDAVIIENHGKPRVAILPVEQLDEFRALKRDAVRREAIEWMLELEAKHASNPKSDLAEDEVMELAVRAVKEVRAERAAKRARDDART
jgi:prevent-host-death family protein